MSPQRYGRGFKRAATLVQSRIRTASESRGFAVSRLLTHWAETVGEDIARIARPVEITYGRGFGATLTLLTSGAQAPMLEMRKEVIRERVNACYGYAAISRVRLTQTAPRGFSEGQATFSAAPPKPRKETVPAEIAERAASAVTGVTDDGLRNALEELGGRVLSRKKQE